MKDRVDEREDEMEMSQLAQTSARRSHLRTALDQRERSLLASAAVTDLSDEHAGIVVDLVQAVLGEPVMSTAQLVEVLEGLLEEPELTPAAVYRRIDDHLSVLRYRLAALALRKGMEIARA